MPVKIIKFLCQFKCGHRAKSKEKDMAYHETTCWFNPALRTCKSCKHESYKKNIETHEEMEGCPNEVWMERDCLNPMVSNDKFEGLLKTHQYFQPNSQFHINPIINCPYWQSKNNLDNQ